MGCLDTISGHNTDASGLIRPGQPGRIDKDLDGRKNGFAVIPSTQSQTENKMV
jgi:hypothetical protein